MAATPLSKISKSLLHHRGRTIYVPRMEGWLEPLSEKHGQLVEGGDLIPGDSSYRWSTGVRSGGSGECVHREIDLESADASVSGQPDSCRFGTAQTVRLDSVAQGDERIDVLAYLC